MTTRRVASAMRSPRKIPPRISPSASPPVSSPARPTMSRSLSGTIAGDLFVFGDIRDVVRESKHLVMGEETDRLILGLATAGLAVTAATYVSVGGATPVRAGLSLVKDARKVGRHRRGARRMGRPFRARGRRYAGAAAGGGVVFGVASRPKRERDLGRLPRREGGRAGASRQGCRPHHARRPARAARWIR